jgi:hypothetical protein
MKLYILLYKILIYLTLYCCINGYDEINDEYYVSKLQMKLLKLSNCVKYILATLDDSIDLREKNNQTITDLLISNGFASMEGDMMVWSMPKDVVTEDNVNIVLKEKIDTEIELNLKKKLMLQETTKDIPDVKILYKSNNNIKNLIKYNHFYPLLETALTSITINVNSIIDSNSNISSCYPINKVSCNLRSAWEVCNTYPNEQCTIELPFNEILHMTKIGDLILNSSIAKSIEIIGHNSIIVGEEPAQTFDVLTIPGFPVENIQLTNTNNALQNYFEGFVYACPNDIITFSSCDLVDSNEDTYYRLFRNGTQIASNDNSCGNSSEIEYEVSSQSKCQNYSIHIGCYGSNSCTTTVTGTLITNINNVYMPRLITYDDKNNNILSPILKISSCTIENFGNIELDGGAISINGSANFELHNVKFNNNTGYNGGSIYLSNLIQPVIINCTFNEIIAINNGGAIYVDTSVTGFIMNNSIFTNCSSLYDGGSIYFNILNSDILISGTLFLSNFANHDGGSIFINEYSSHFTIIDCKFGNGQAGRIGGGIILNS